MITNYIKTKVLYDYYKKNSIYYNSIKFTLNFIFNNITISMKLLCSLCRKFTKVPKILLIKLTFYKKRKI